MRLRKRGTPVPTPSGLSTTSGFRIQDGPLDGYVSCYAYMELASLTDFFWQFPRAIGVCR